MLQHAAATQVTVGETPRQCLWVAVLMYIHAQTTLSNDSQHTNVQGLQQHIQAVHAQACTVKRSDPSQAYLLMPGGTDCLGNWNKLIDCWL